MQKSLDVVDENERSVDTTRKNTLNRWFYRFIPEIKAKHLLYTTIAGFVLGIILTLSVVFAISDIINPKPTDNPLTPSIMVVPDDHDYTLTISTVQEVLKPTAALITSEYHYTAADIFDDYKKLFGFNLPFTNTKAVFTYKGTMSIGLDLQKINYQIDNEKKVIQITLPETGILSHDIDMGSFRFPYEEESIFNPKEMSDYVGVLDQLKSTQAELLLNDQEYMDNVVNNTEEVIKLFLANSEFTKDYTVIFTVQGVS